MGSTTQGCKCQTWYSCAANQTTYEDARGTTRQRQSGLGLRTNEQISRSSTLPNPSAYLSLFTPDQGQGDPTGHFEDLLGRIQGGHTDLVPDHNSRPTPEDQGFLHCWHPRRPRSDEGTSKWPDQCSSLAGCLAVGLSITPSRQVYPGSTSINSCGCQRQGIPVGR